MRVNDEPGYVLKRQDYGDTSLLVDVFTHSHGRFRLIAKGARSGRAEKARALQPFQKLHIGWTGRSDLKTLTQMEATPACLLDKHATACGFYINELLWNFLEIQDPHETLFDCYEHSLNALSLGEGQTELEPLLRRFEFLLLQEVGYGLSFDVDSDTGEQIQPDQSYVFHIDRGLVAAQPDEETSALGESFLAMANFDFSEKATLVLAKKLARQIIHHRLDGRELYSRKWFQQTLRPASKEADALAKGEISDA